MNELRCDPAAVADWLDRVYGHAPGWLSIAHMTGAGQFRAGAFADTHDQAVDVVTALDRAGARGIYLRTTTLTAKPTDGGRGGADLARYLPGLWADVDLAGPGHKHDPAKHDGRELPPDEEAGRQLVRESGLPAPSLWVHSGGGLYPWWLLDEPLGLDDDNRTGTALLSSVWQGALHQAGRRLGYEYGAGVGDLARVLRVPGTINRKTDDPRPCRLLEDTRARYTLAEFQAAAAAIPLPADDPPPAPQRAVPSPSTRPHPPVAAGGSAFDQLDQHVTFDDILTSAGWTHHRGTHPASVAQCWTRPDGPDNPCSAHTLTAQPEVLVVWSESAALPTGAGRRLTRGRLFAHLHHQGDERAAALDLYAAIGGRPSTPAAAALPLPRDRTPVPTPTTAPLADRPPPYDDLAGLIEPRPDDWPADQDLGESGPPPATADLASSSLLPFRTIAQIRADVTARGPRRWLLRGIWPAGDYGVHAAEKKAQKTWNTVDLAVAVASGTSWLGFIPVDNPGPVIMFVGEGGDGNTLRRIDAAAEERGLKADDLAIHICTRAPHLNNLEHMALFALRVDQVRPALITLDPLYLAARGAELGDLYKMGALLEGPQHIAQDAGAALFVVTHFNRQQGKGASRITGAGPAEWGRVLISASVKAKNTDPDTRGSRVLTELDIIGGEIPDQTLRLTRHIHADDPDDLDSPLHMQTTAAWGDADLEDGDTSTETEMPPAARKLLEAIDATTQPTSSVHLVDWIAGRHGHGLTRETVSRTLNQLLATGAVDYLEETGAGGRWPTKLWFRPTPSDPRDITRDGHTASNRVIPRDRVLTVTGSRHGHTVTSPTDHPNITGQQPLETA